MATAAEQAAVQRLLSAVAERVDPDRVRELTPSAVAAVADAMAAMVPRPAPDPWAELLGPVYAWDAVARVLGVTSRPAVDHARRRHRVLAFLTRDGRWAYPASQFVLVGSRLQPAPGLPAALEVLVPAADGLAAARWLATANRRLGGRRPIDLVRAGEDLDDVLDAARAQARLWDGSSRP